MRLPLLGFITGAILSLMTGLASTAEFDLVYPRPVSRFDQRSDYPLKLLELALDKAGKSYTLSPSKHVMNKARVTTALGMGEEVNIAWMVTSKERETQLLPIRICIFKGLGGWRIALVRQEDLTVFARIRGLADLRQYKAGQQIDWPDTAILKASDLLVETSGSYEQLFKMLSHKRFDWFPRSIPEIWAEADAYRKDGLVVESHFILHYPSAYYFFVNKRDAALAKVIEQGLEIALKDGSFDKLFREYHGDVIKRAKLRERLVIELPNPFLPAETPLDRKALWFRVGLAK